MIRIGPEVPPGDYELKVSMLLPERPGRRISCLGIAGRDEDDRYRLWHRHRRQRVRGLTGAVYEQGFETDDHGWSMSSGIEGRIGLRHVFHGGKSSLRLSGVQQGSWNYASHYLATPVLPGSKYRLSCWLKVDELDPARMAPYLKIGLTDGDGGCWRTATPAATT